MRGRLLVLVTATMSLVLLAFLLPLAVLLGDVAEDRAVNGASAAAQNLTSTVATADRASVDVAVQQINASGPYRLSVYLADGGVLGAQAPRSMSVRAAANGSSFSTSTAAGTEILTYAKDSAGGATVIRAFVPTATLTDGVARSRLILIAVGVGLLAIGIVVADRLATTVVRPTRELATVSHRLARGDLAARATPGGPTEIADVGVAVNHLAGRIQELLAEETERIADLSHRLRTPMTSLRLEAEALESTSDSQRMVQAVDDLERSITDVISVARRRHAAASGGTSACDAATVVAGRVEFWSVLAEDTERQVDKSIVDVPVLVATSKEDLAACVDALLGNVFAHTPDGTDFAVTLRVANSGAVLVVGDAGPGLPDTRALDRGVSGAGSSGLGLDIVRRTAQATGGSVSLGRAPTGGAEITVHLAAPPT